MSILFFMVFLIFLIGCTENDSDENYDAELEEPVVVERGWHLVEGYFSPPDKLYYESSTMNHETGMTILTFLDDTEGYLHLNVHSHWTQGHHNNATTFLGDGIYHWEPPQDALKVGERITLSMRVEPLSPGMNLSMVGYQSRPYERAESDPFFAYYMSNSPSTTNLYYIRTEVVETLYSRSLEEGKEGDYIAIRITLINGLMSDIYWYYIYQWVEGNE